MSRLQLVPRLGRVLGLHVLDQIDHAVGVTELVVVPGDQLDKGLGQLDTSLSIEDGGPIVPDEVGGDHHVLGVAENTLHGCLRSLLELGADLLVGGFLLEPDSEINHRDVGGWDPEGHAGQLAVQVGDDLSDSLGSSGGGGDDVLGSATSTSPVLAGGPVDGLLCGGGGVDGGHQTLQDTVVVMDHLGKGSKTVGGAGGVGDNLHVLLISSLVDAHDEHGGVGGGGGDDDLLGATGVMGACLLDGGEDAGGLDDILGAGAGPVDGSGVPLAKDGDSVAVDDELSVLGLNAALELSVGRVVLEHVHHVVKRDEGIIDGDDLGALGDGGAENQATDAAESVDTDGRHCCG